MKKSDALWAGNESRWSLQSRNPDARPSGDAFHNGFVSLQQGYGAAPDRPMLRTYGAAAEKYAYSAYVEPGKLRISGPAPLRAGETWGVGGSIPEGVRRSAPYEIKDMAPTGKRHFMEVPTPTWKLEENVGAKTRVYNSAGLDVRHLRSGETLVSTAMQRKARVPEEARTEARSIDRPAPPGMKGFIGAEYHPDYWKLDGVVTRMRMKPSRDDLAELALKRAAERGEKLGKTKSFAQKRIEEDVRDQQELVKTLMLEYDYLDDDEDRRTEKEY